MIWDDFESYNVDGFPAPDWIPLARATEPNTNNHVSLDPDSGSPTNKALQLEGVVNNSASAFHAFANPSNFVIEARIWNGNEDQPVGWGRGSIGIRKGVAFVPGRTLFGFFPNGTWTGEGGLSGPYETEQWYDVKIHYNRQGSELNLRYWFDDAFVGDANVSTFDMEASFDHLDLNAGGTAYFDDIHVRAVPEPATAAIALVGIIAALGVARRRRSD